jgi:hypothetical protein
LAAQHVSSLCREGMLPADWGGDIQDLPGAFGE